MKKEPMKTALHIWPIFSVKMVADLYGIPLKQAQANLDTMVEQGSLHRWSQSECHLPDIYFST